jgi:hypothetical protein
MSKKLTAQQRQHAIDVFKSSPMFHSCSDKNVALIVDAMDLVECKEGEVVVQQGYKTTRMFIVLEGLIDRVRVEDGKI